MTDSAHSAAIESTKQKVKEAVWFIMFPCVLSAFVMIAICIFCSQLFETEWCFLIRNTVTSVTKSSEFDWVDEVHEGCTDDHQYKLRLSFQITRWATLAMMALGAVPLGASVGFGAYALHSGVTASPRALRTYVRLVKWTAYWMAVVGVILSIAAASYFFVWAVKVREGTAIKLFLLLGFIGTCLCAFAGLLLSRCRTDISWQTAPEELEVKPKHTETWPSTEEVSRPGASSSPPPQHWATLLCIVCFGPCCVNLLPQPKADGTENV
jgi:hypothetical protein